MSGARPSDQTKGHPDGFAEAMEDPRRKAVLAASRKVDEEARVSVRRLIVRRFADEQADLLAMLGLEES